MSKAYAMDMVFKLIDSTWETGHIPCMAKSVVELEAPR